MHVYRAWNGPMPTTAAQAAATTGTAIKTMLQISTPSDRQLQIISWGFGFRSTPGGASVVELLETDVAATGGTAHVASGVQPTNPGQPASKMTLGAGNTGFSFTTEGATTATRVFDVQEMYDNSVGGLGAVNYRYQFMPKEIPTVGISKFLRVRATFTSAANLVCWICWDE